MKISECLHVFWFMETNSWDGPKWDQEVLFPANPDLADILGDMGLVFENFDFGVCFGSKFIDFQVARFPKSGPGRAWAGPGLSHLG